LLVDLRAEPAIEPALDVLATTEVAAEIHGRIIERLPEFGVKVLEPALGRLAACTSAEVRISIAMILARLRVLDERIFLALSDIFQDEPLLGAPTLADYGDDRALLLFEAALASLEPNWGEEDPLRALGMIAACYEDLAGPIPDALEARMRVLEDRWRSYAAGGSVSLH
jgi:hypothetical protein